MTPFIPRILLTVCAAVLLSAPAAFAQERGRLTGRVLDSDVFLEVTEPVAGKRYFVPHILLPQNAPLTVKLLGKTPLLGAMLKAS